MKSIHFSSLTVICALLITIGFFSCSRRQVLTPQPPLVSQNWQRDYQNLLSGFGNMYNPHVIEDPGLPYPYRMYFFGWAREDCNPGYSGCDAIYLARSKDLVNWQVYCGEAGWDSELEPGKWVPIIEGGDTYFDEWHSGDPSVVKHEGKYYMAYSSTGWDRDRVITNWEGDTDDDLSVVMGAVSNDGIHWEKSTKPILMYKPEIGKPNEYGNSEFIGSFHRPSLMRDENRWRLWFDYWQPGPMGIGMGHAECHGDPMNPEDWEITHDLNQSLIAEWPNPDVAKIDGLYFSCSDPAGYPGQTGWPGRQIREAISPDGIHWELLDFLPPDRDTPANQVPEYYVHEEDGQRWLYIFYACQIGGEPYNFRYNRIRSMKRLLPGR
jgi:hypothetical protein